MRLLRIRIPNTAQKMALVTKYIYRDKWNHTRMDVAEVHEGQIQGGQQAVGRHARRVTHVQSHLEIWEQTVNYNRFINKS
jgi:hypothetical protein